MCAAATGAAQVAPGLRSLAAAPRLCEPCIHAGSVDKRPDVSGRDNMFKCPCQTCSCQTSLACLLISGSCVMIVTAAGLALQYLLLFTAETDKSLGLIKICWIKR